MTIRFFSDKNRPVHLGPFPIERLERGEMPDLAAVPAYQPLDHACSIVGSLYIPFAVSILAIALLCILVYPH